jgi:hypothetical protein
MRQHQIVGAQQPKEAKVSLSESEAKRAESTITIERARLNERIIIGERVKTYESTK